MRDKFGPWRFVWLVLLAFALASCSGGSSSTQSVLGNGGNPANTPPTNGGSALGRTLLPTSGQANSVGLQLAQSTDGALHAVYADIEGRIIYARCDVNCGTGNAWQSVEVDKVDLGFSGYAVARLELDAMSRPRIAFHVVPGSFDAGNTHFAQCDTACLNSASWESAAVLGHGGNLLEFRLANTDWFALDEAGNPVISFLVQNGLLDTDKRLRLYSCRSNCIQNAGWSERTIATYPITLARPVNLDIDAEGQMQLAVHIEGIGADVSTLTWFGCVDDCLGDGVWSDGVALQGVESDLDSLPDASLSIGTGGRAMVASFDDADQATLTLHTCDSDCSLTTSWQSQIITDRVQVPGGIFDAGYGLDTRFDGDALELVFAAKAAGSPLRQLIVESRCDSQCESAAGVWQSRVLARTDEQLPDEAICVFIGTRLSSSLSVVTGAVGFTASPQWACSVEPVLVTGPDGESFYDNASDIRFLELSSVVVF